MKQPAIFISHGAPTIVIEPSAARHAIEGLANHLQKPDAIIIASAHFETDIVEVVSDPTPETVYDFGRFDDRLFEMKYPAKGSPEIAQTVLAQIEQAGIGARMNPKRGFDHGVWTPLMLAFGDADIPVVQVSIQPARDAGHHFRVGQALSKLRENNVLVIGSGHITHNLREIFQVMQGSSVDAQIQAQVVDFIHWIEARLLANDTESLLDWYRSAPFAEFNHPSFEHFMPLFFAYGAGGINTRASLLHRSTEHGYLTSDIWQFD